MLTSAGNSTIYGLKSEINYSDDKNWLFNFNLGYIPDADTGNFAREDVVIEETRLPFTSEWNIGSRVQWQDEIGNGQLKAEIGVDFQSAFFFDQNENPYTRQASYSVWNARVGYALPSGFSFGLWAKNLFNKEYAELRFDVTNTTSCINAFKGARGLVGVDMMYEF